MGKWTAVNNARQSVDLTVDPFTGTPPKGMVPSSIPSIYTTPEVIQPDDCDNYPDSIFCGGNPISRSPLDLEIEINADKCGVSVRAKPTIAHFKFPSHGVAYVKPECRNEPPPYTPPPPFHGIEDHQSMGGFDRSISDSEFVYAGICMSEASNFRASCGIGKPSVTAWQATLVTPLRLSYGYGETYLDNNGDSIPLSAWGEVNVQQVDPNIASLCGEGGSGEPYIPGIPFSVRVNINPTQDGDTYIYKINSEGYVYKVSKVSGNDIDTFPEYSTPPHYDVKIRSYIFTRNELQIAYGRWGDIQRYYAKYYERVIEINQGSEYMFDLLCYDVLRPDELPPPNYPFYRDTFKPNRKGCDCMGCCASSPYEQTKEKEQDRKRDECCEEMKKLLKEIKNILGTGKAKIEFYDVDPNKVEAQKKTVTTTNLTAAFEQLSKLHTITQKAIGVDDMPIQYPDSIVEPVNENILQQTWDFITPDKVRKITSLAQMIDWQNDQQSATIGKLQRKITQEVEDNRVQSDGTVKKGSKQVSVVLPDLATALEEIYKMNIQIIKALGMNTDIGIKGLQEGVNSSVMTAESLQRIKSIQEFFSFPTDQKSTELPIQITIPEKGKEKDVEKDLLKYLQTSKQQIVWDDFDGSQSMYEMMTELLVAASIIRATFYGTT